MRNLRRTLKSGPSSRFSDLTPLLDSGRDAKFHEILFFTMKIPQYCHDQFSKIFKTSSMDPVCHETHRNGKILMFLKNIISPISKRSFLSNAQILLRVAYLMHTQPQRNRRNFMVNLSEYNVNGYFSKFLIAPMLQ